MSIIGFDADGPLLDSRLPAWRYASQILELLGTRKNIASQRDFELHFGAEALNQLVGEDHAGALRMTHRLAMSKIAPSLPLFSEALAVASSQPLPRIIITAALAQGVRTALGSSAEIFQSIMGFEKGRKPMLLAAVADRLRVYVTDTTSDIRICRSLGIPVIAITWGYDTSDDLAAAEPTAIAGTAEELAAALARFHTTPTETKK